jgi:hypothetical protein
MRDLRNDTLAHFLAAPGRFAIFGAGATGAAVLGALAGCGLKPTAFIDSYRTGERLGLDVLPPEEALGLDCVVTAGRHARDMTVQLRADGFEGPVLDLGQVHRKEAQAYFDETRLDAAAVAIGFARRLLQHDGSRERLDALLRYRRQLDPGDLPPAPPGEGYDAVPIMDGDWVLDVGSPPEALLALAEAVGPLGRVHALEPDPARRAALSDAAATSAFGARLAIHPLACGDACHAPASDEDDESPAVVSVDEFVWESASGRVDRIEIAAAGALEILDGAAATLAEHRPRIALDVAHAPSDLWEVPIRLKERFPGYRLFLAHHSQGLARTRCYARPTEAD